MINRTAVNFYIKNMDKITTGGVATANYLTMVKFIFILHLYITIYKYIYLYIVLYNNI
jgi:hypothetical protein